MNNYPSASYEKSSKKSQKNLFRGENLPSSGCGVTFTLLKLLCYPAKVGLLQRKSYSVTTGNFTHFSLILFNFSTKVSPLFNTHFINSLIKNALQNRFILTFIRADLFSS